MTLGHTSARRRVKVIALGGTIASVPRDASDAVSPGLDASQLVSSVPQLDDVAEVEAETLSTKASGDLTFADIVHLARNIDSSRAEFDGFVVTQGTDTLEETAFLLSLLVPQIPVAITGAMRNPGLPSADGPTNLLNSAIVAVSEKARALGAVVVMADEVHSPRYVAKTHTSEVNAFVSPGSGPLGRVTESELRLMARPVPSLVPEFDLQSITDIPKVPLLKVYGGWDPEIAEVVSADASGLVLEAFGGGHVPSSCVETLERIALRIPVVVSSRTGAGDVYHSTYGFRGSETDLRAKGLFFAGDLTGLKARVLLMCLLATGATHAEVEQWIACQ